MSTKILTKDVPYALKVEGKDNGSKGTEVEILGFRFDEMFDSGLCVIIDVPVYIGRGRNSNTVELDSSYIQD